MSQLSLVGKRQSVNFDNIPSEILFEFLIRLSAWDLARARLTCKAWHSIISDAGFVNLHLKHSSKHHGYIYTFDLKQHYFIDSSSMASASSIKLKLREGLNPYCGNSSGGLMAYTMKNYTLCHICNPITGEEIKVSMGPFWGEGFYNNWCGLCYSQTSKEYKILLLAIPLTKGKDMERVSKGAIYTLGARSAWREIPGDIPYFICNCDSKPLNFEGGLFWSASRSSDWDAPKCIASFDIDLEKFKLWKSPKRDSQIGSTHMTCPLSTGGTLAFAVIDLDSIRIWMLRDKLNEIWVNEIFIPLWSYVYRDLTMFGEWATNNTLFPCILVSFGDSLVIYNTKYESYKSLVSSSKQESLETRATCICHIASLVSPKQIMAVASPKA